MKNIQCALFISLIVFLGSCNTRYKSYEEMIPAPSISILDQSGKQIASDSLKLTLKSQKKSSIFKLVLDGDNEEKDVKVTVVNGSGTLLIDGKSGMDYRLSNGVHTVSYTPSAISGSTLIVFDAKTYLDRLTTAKMEVVTYANVNPKAALEVVKTPVYSNLQYTLDASSSTDGDSYAGGHIVQYSFKVNEKVLVTENSSIPWVFGDTGTYSVSVTVTDNDGGKATFTIPTFSVN